VSGFTFCTEWWNLGINGKDYGNNSLHAHITRFAADVVYYSAI
jgi:hypothetical protein